MHEIGHAMAAADIRKAWGRYSSAQDAYNNLVDKYKAASGKKQALYRKATKAKTNLAKLDKRLIAAEAIDGKFRAVREFERLAKGLTPVTEYASTSATEAFAETFAMYKLNPKGIKSMNPRLAQWFRKQGYLKE